MRPLAWNRRRWLLALAVVAIFALALAAYRLRIRPDDLALWLRGVSQLWWAPLAFIALYTLFNLALVPATILTLTAGVVWGWLEGGLWVIVASTIGSAAPYFLAKNGSAPFIALMERRTARVAEALRREGFLSLLLIRLIPIFPYNVINYAAGLAGVRPRDYLLATFFGTLPGIFIFTWLSDSLAVGLVTPRQAFVRILLAGVLLAGLILGGRAFAGRVRKRVEG